MSKIYEVRCCCQPQKLLGWMQLPDGLTSHVRLVPPVELLRWRDPKAPTHHTPPEVELPIVRFNRAPGVSYPAIKAEGMTQEELMKFPCFTPNKDGVR